MFEAIYEITLDGKQILIDKESWEKIRDNVFYNKWFCITYNGQLYKYFRSTLFNERPAIYRFVKFDPIKENMVDIIEI